MLPVHSHVFCFPAVFFPFNGQEAISFSYVHQGTCRETLVHHGSNSLGETTAIACLVHSLFTDHCVHARHSWQRQSGKKHASPHQLCSADSVRKPAFCGRVWPGLLQANACICQSCRRRTRQCIGSGGHFGTDERKQKHVALKNETRLLLKV